MECSGDLDQAQRLRLAARAHWLFLNGAPTAELRARPYASIGISATASPVHSFAPEIAQSYFLGLKEGDDDWVEDLLREFFVPLTELWAARPGYVVSLPKAAARLRGEHVGGVRAPLVDPDLEHIQALQKLLDKGLHLVAPGW